MIFVVSARFPPQVLQVALQVLQVTQQAQQVPRRARTRIEPIHSDKERILMLEPLKLPMEQRTNFPEVKILSTARQGTQSLIDTDALNASSYRSLSNFCLPAKPAETDFWEARLSPGPALFASWPQPLMSHMTSYSQTKIFNFFSFSRRHEPSVKCTYWVCISIAIASCASPRKAPPSLSLLAWVCSMYSTVDARETPQVAHCSFQLYHSTAVSEFAADKEQVEI